VGLFGWYVFLGAQGAIFAAVGFACLVLTDMRQSPENADRSFIGFSFGAIALLIVDVLTMGGVIGHGWPPSTKTSIELLAAAAILGLTFLTAEFVEDHDRWRAFVSLLGALVVVAFEVLLLTNVFWHQGSITSPPAAMSTSLAPSTSPSTSDSGLASGSSQANPSPSLGSTATGSPTNPAAPQATSSSGSDSPATWVTAAGTLLGGLGTILTAILAMRRRREQQ
jgi:hypothetical protein